MATLNQHRRRPALAPLSLAHLGVDDVMKNWPKLLEYLGNGGLVSQQVRPEAEAARFYLSNAAFAEITRRFAPDEQLPEPINAVTEVYQAVVRASSLRLFYYLLVICSRESRHYHSSPMFEKALDNKYGCMKFTQGIRGSSSHAVEKRMITDPPKLNLGKYVSHLHDLFDEGSFSSSYGGKAWASVAKPLRDFVHGVLPPELLLDVGFTLAHNGGPIFNKGLLYTEFDTSSLLQILDVQRGGQVPQLVHSGINVHASDGVARGFLQLYQNALGADWGTGALDWEAIQKAGAVQDYSAFIPKKVAVPKSELFTASELVKAKKVKRVA